ncbi:hypothetical protein XENOCAPTIV_023185 [Xenoophorus captivus]|uniref:Uncharacterized protein n=1 Tax=Xenoophorus captivus TaxID=1517983 RepID=A0ABV0S8J5_9TELE
MIIFYLSLACVSHTVSPVPGSIILVQCLCFRFKMFGELPLLSLRISDYKLRSVLELVDSIPLPESKPAARSTASSANTKEDLFYDAPSSPIGDKAFFPDNPLPLRYADLGKRANLVKEDPPKNMSNFHMKFEINELCRQTGAQEVIVLQLDIEGLGTELRLFTFNMTSNIFLREICLKCPEYMGW